MSQRLLLAAVLLTTGIAASPDAVAASADAAAGEADKDPNTGLTLAPGWELAAAHCGGCHSHQLVTAQRGDRDFWLNTIRWMQKTQNLWQIPAAQETVLLDYLAANYNETDWGRRPALSASLMPGAAVEP